MAGADAVERPTGLSGIFAFMYGDFLGQLVVAPLLVLVLVMLNNLQRCLRVWLWFDVVGDQRVASQPRTPGHAYRICQAAVRDASRSQSIRRLLIRIDVSPGNGHHLAVRIQIDVEASPFLEVPFEVHPLPTITDRVLAQQGSYTVEALQPGVRHLIHFEEDSGSLL
ncbi:MAG: hypothetical protein WC213_04890 [Arenimonas sp.]